MHLKADLPGLVLQLLAGHIISKAAGAAYGGGVEAADQLVQCPSPTDNVFSHPL